MAEKKTHNQTNGGQVDIFDFCASTMARSE
jgi:hypothetical protein